MDEVGAIGLAAVIVGLIGLLLSDQEGDHALGLAIGVAAIALVLLGVSGFRIS